MGAYNIPFTQYMRPHGRPVSVSIDVPEDVAAKAGSIIESGFVFECEVLQDGDVSLTITDPEEGDLAIEVLPNGPGIREAVEKMVREFSAERVQA